MHICVRNIISSDHLPNYFSQPSVEQEGARPAELMLQQHKGR